MVQINMNMPTCCLDCPLFRDAFNSCQFIGHIDNAASRHQNCPLIKVPTAYWKVFSNGAYHGMDEDGEPIWREVNVYHCSHCNRRTVIKEKYCPSCGALMNGEEQVNE